MTSHKPGDIYFGEYVRFSTSDKKVEQRSQAPIMPWAILAPSIRAR